MPLRNKFRAMCIDCGHDMLVGEGLSEKRETLNLPGTGWVSKHYQCSFTPVRPIRRDTYRPDPDPSQIHIYDEWDEFNITQGMTESEFFGGSLGDNH